MAAQQPDLSATAVADVAPVAGARQRRGGWLRSLELSIPGGILVLIVAACFLGPIVLPIEPPVGGNPLNANLPLFAPGHLFGTDAVGNDILSRILYGGRISIEVAVATNVIGIVVGGLLGTLAGFWGGVVDSGIMRVLDVLIAFPSLVLALVLAEALQPSEMHVIWALSVFAIPAFARIARSATLRVREQNFMLAARLSGTRARRVLLRHVSPLILPQLLTFALLFLGVTILIAAALSYLGLSVHPPNPTWGNMISDGQAYLSSKPRLVLVPSAFLFVTVLCFNLLGDAARARWASL